MQPLMIHRASSRSAARKRAIELLDLVGIPSPDDAVDRYPHQMSGGQRQRVMIASAIACEPKLLIADEPTTALDVTVQAQVLALIADLRRKMGLACLLITHDLGVVNEVCDRAYVMQTGRIVEEGSAAGAVHRAQARLHARAAARQSEDRRAARGAEGRGGGGRAAAAGRDLDQAVRRYVGPQGDCHR